MRINPFSIIVTREASGRYQAVARTIDGDRTAYGASHLAAFLAVLRVAWQVSINH